MKQSRGGFGHLELELGELRRRGGAREVAGRRAEKNRRSRSVSWKGSRLASLGGFGSGEDTLRGNLRDRFHVRPSLEQEPVDPHRVESAGSLHGQNLPRLRRFQVRVALFPFQSVLLFPPNVFFLFRLVSRRGAPALPLRRSDARPVPRAQTLELGLGVLEIPRRPRERLAPREQRRGEVERRQPKRAGTFFVHVRALSVREFAAEDGFDQARVPARDRDVQNGPHARDVIVHTVHVLV